MGRFSIFHSESCVRNVFMIAYVMASMELLLELDRDAYCVFDVIFHSSLFTASTHDSTGAAALLNE